MDQQDREKAAANLEPPTEEAEAQLELEAHENDTVEDHNQEIAMNSHYTGTEELDSRPQSNLVEGAVEGLPEENATILRRLHRRFARMQEKKPVMTQSLSQSINSRFSFIINSVKDEKCEQAFLTSVVEEAQVSRALLDMFDAIESKVENEYRTGEVHRNQAGSESLEIWTRKYQLFSKRNEIEKLLFNKDELKELEKVQKKRAIEFSTKMKHDSDSITKKFKDQAEKRTRKAQTEQQEALEREMRKKKQQLEQQRIKAESALSEVKLRKQHREQTKRIAAMREKKVHEITPLHVIKETEFKKQEDQMYNSRGRTLESLEKFLQDKRKFHLLRNRKNFDIYLLDPDFEETYGNPRSVSRHSGFKTSMNTKNNLRQSKLEKPIMMGGIDIEEPVKFTPLPRIKYVHK